MFAGAIYGVRRVGDAEFRYVGQTRSTVSHRQMQHWKAARGGRRYPLYDWLRKFESIEDVFFQSLEVVIGGEDDLNAAEIRWIRELRAHGDRLLNLTDGGGGQRGYIWNDEQRRAASERNRGRKGVSRFGADNPMWAREHSDEQKAKWSEARKGSIAGKRNPNFGKHGPAHPSYGRTLSAETRERLSEQKRGELNPNFGKFASAETRARMSAVRKGRPMPSSVRSAHTRHHTNKGIFKESCQHCVADRTNSIQGSDES